MADRVIIALNLRNIATITLAGFIGFTVIAIVVAFVSRNMKTSAPNLPMAQMAPSLGGQAG